MVVDASFYDTSEDCFRLVNLAFLDVSDGAKGQDLFTALRSFLEENGLFRRVKILVTDGASAVYNRHNVAQSKAMGARFQAESEQLSVTWWCLAHRVSLCIQDACQAMPRSVIAAHPTLQLHQSVPVCNAKCLGGNE